MAFVVLHQRDAGSEKIIDVEAFTIDANGVDKLRHPGQTPLLVDTGAGLRIVWASEGKDAGQFGDVPVPLAYDPKTGAPIYDQGKLQPIGYDPATGAAIYPAAVKPAPAQPAPIAQ